MAITGSQDDAGSMGDSSGFSLGTAGTLGLGVLGFGSMLASGPPKLPTQFTQAETEVPYLQQTGHSLVGQGQTLVGQGTDALAMGQRGELTPEQAAQLKVYSGGLTNQARQQFANMGRNPDQDTAFISTTADIDTKVNAMAQQEIQTTIQLGLGEISGGNSLIASGSGFENAANNILLEAGKAQIQSDKDYSASLTSAFSSIATLFGGAAKAGLFAV